MYSTRSPHCDRIHIQDPIPDRLAYRLKDHGHCRALLQTLHLIMQEIILIFVSQRNQEPVVFHPYCPAKTKQLVDIPVTREHTGIYAVCCFLIRFSNLRYWSIHVSVHLPNSWFSSYLDLNHKLESFAGQARNLSNGFKRICLAARASRTHFDIWPQGFDHAPSHRLRIRIRSVRKYSQSWCRVAEVEVRFHIKASRTGLTTRESCLR